MQRSTACSEGVGEQLALGIWALSAPGRPCPGSVSVPPAGFGASIHSKKGTNFRDQSFITAGIVCSSCQGGRCSTGRGTWSILASWECHRRQEQDVVPGLWGGSSRSLAHVGVHEWAAPAVPGSTGSAREQETPRKIPEGQGWPGLCSLPCQERSAHVVPGSAQLQLLLCSCLGLSHRAAAVLWSEFPGVREFPGQLQDSSTSLWDEEGAGSVGKGTAAGITWSTLSFSAQVGEPCAGWGHHLLSSPQGPFSDTPQLEGAARSQSAPEKGKERGCRSSDECWYFLVSSTGGVRGSVEPQITFYTSLADKWILSC